MKSKLQKTRFSIFGYFVFFVMVSIISTVSILVSTMALEKTQSVGITAIITLLIILFMSLLCSTFDLIRRRVMIERPVKEILRVTEKVTKGDFSVRLEPLHNFGKFDEYDVIMQNLNEMIEELSKQEILKNDFISNVSHEIKTPLSTIQNSSTALLSKNLTEEKKQEYLQILVSSSKKLTDLVSNILKLNKLENQIIVPESEIIDLSELLSEIVLGFDERLEQKEIELTCDFDEIKINSDTGMIEIIFNNLISNAIKFTDKNGKIKISLKEESNFAVISVQDNGVGISPETGKHIFDKFYQGDTSHSVEGNGLGLALVKKVVDILGGEILVESELKKGSTFTVKLHRGEL